MRVLHPGFRSVEGGPDFCDAVVQIGEEAPRSGDVEVDVRCSGWRAHGHDRNPAFQKVILHVVWDGEHPILNGPPVMLLRPVLDAPLGELSLWLSGDAAQILPEPALGKCCAPLRQMSADRVAELLHQAGGVRLHSKAAQFQARARQAGWEQSLWEGLFRGLGYKQNVWPMQRLGELRSRWQTPQAEALVLQGRLLGIGGLLPADLTSAQLRSEPYFRRIWDEWWRERDQYSDCLLPQTLWRFHGLRPANHPQRRLALAARWSAAGGLPLKLERWCASEVSDDALANSLLEALEVGPDDFWSWHWTLRSSRLKQAQPLLGLTRVTDLAVNVVLPWLWVRALEGKNERVQRAVEHRYFAWPAAQDNAILRLARQRLLGTTSRKALSNAAAQQGLLQLVRDFCDHSNSICESCKLPELVREFASRQGSM